MMPTLVIVGRPNVGKSTLFNRLTRSRAALVHDTPGLTRDRHYGVGQVGTQRFWLVDTGGFEPQAKTGIEQEMARQAEAALSEADVLLFVVDARAGLQTQDQVIYERLRRSGRPLQLWINKAEGMAGEMAAAEFHSLGCAQWAVVSGAHGDGVSRAIEAALAAVSGTEEEHDSGQTDAAAVRTAPAVAIVGRPNVGKSTLINALLGEERVIAFDLPGTTRDAIPVPFVRGGRHYTLIDTAGMRRRGKVFETIEKFSVLKTLQAIEAANVAVLLLDAAQDISDQDAHIAAFCADAGRALVLAINKWDAVDAYRRRCVREEVARRLGFLDFARVLTISARNGQGVEDVLRAVDEAWIAAMVKLPTPRITRVLLEAVRRQAPPRAGVSRPKLRYAHQGGSNPPLIVLHGNNLEALPQSYLRYLEHRFREAFRLAGTPLRLQVKRSSNPFADS